MLQPTAEALIEAINDRRITLLAMPETGARCRGEVILSTWNTFLRDGALRRHLLAAHRPRPRRRRRRWSATASSRATSSRRSSRPRASTPACRRGCAACAATSTASQKQPRRGVPHAAQPGRRPRAAGRHRGAAAGPQELSRRATPTVIMPVEVPMPPLDALAPPDRRRRRGLRSSSEPAPSGAVPGRDCCAHGVRRDPAAAWAAPSPSGRAGTGSPTSAIPIAEHHAVREAVGIWDESPLRKWLFDGPDALAAADYVLHQRHGRARASARCATAPFCDEQRQDARRRRRLPRRGRRERAGRDRARRPTATTSARSSRDLDVEIERAHARDARTCRCRGRARASCSPR